MNAQVADTDEAWMRVSSEERRRVFDRLGNDCGEKSNAVLPARDTAVAFSVVP